MVDARRGKPGTDDMLVNTQRQYHQPPRRFAPCTDINGWAGWTRHCDGLVIARPTPSFDVENLADASARQRLKRAMSPAVDPR